MSVAKGKLDSAVATAEQRNEAGTAPTGATSRQEARGAAAGVFSLPTLLSPSSASSWQTQQGYPHWQKQKCNLKSCPA